MCRYSVHTFIQWYIGLYSPSHANEDDNGEQWSHREEEILLLIEAYREELA